MAYRHTQVGTVILGSLGLAGVLILGLCIQAGWDPIAVAVLCIMAAAAGLFYSLTVEIKDGMLEWRFGPGLIRRRAALGEVRDVRVVRNPWHYGWGIHWTFQGWVYNVAGLGAVAVTLASGKRFRIGTDEPEKLAEAIRRGAGLG